MPAAIAETTMHIGEVAERAGLSLRTVRYYEEQGLFEPAGRTTGGFRLYTQAEVDRLLFIKQCKPLGFTVDQMRELLVARDELSSGDTGTRQQAERRMAAYAQDVATRCAGLRDQLARAEAFARQLSEG